METYSPNKLYINKNNILYNLKQIKNKINYNNSLSEVQIMPILKADAYGVGLINILPIIKEFEINMIGVASVEEGIELRKLFSGEIILLSQAFVEQIPEIIRYRLTPVVSNLEFLKELDEYSLKNKFNNNIVDNNNYDIKKVHIKINTGMNRIGVRYDEIEDFLKSIKSFKNIYIEGLITHFSSSSIDLEFTKLQKNRFEYVVEIFKQKIQTIKYVHCSNSGGIINSEQNNCNLVRPGIMLYGYYPDISDNLNLKPALEFKTRIASVQKVKAGESIGYNKKYYAEHDMKIGILPFGYADGFIAVKNKEAHVLINDKKIKILAVCMDTIIIDLSNTEGVSIGTDVIIWDNDKITVEDWAKWMACINYELITNLSKRIERVIF